MSHRPKLLSFKTRPTAGFGFHVFQNVKTEFRSSRCGSLSNVEKYVNIFRITFSRELSKTEFGVPTYFPHSLSVTFFTVDLSVTNLGVKLGVHKKSLLT